MEQQLPKYKKNDTIKFNNTNLIFKIVKIDNNTHQYFIQSIDNPPFNKLHNINFDDIDNHTSIADLPAGNIKSIIHNAAGSMNSAGPNGGNKSFRHLKKRKSGKTRKLRKLRKLRKTRRNKRKRRI
jgi:hypothetical protein